MAGKEITIPLPTATPHRRTPHVCNAAPAGHDSPVGKPLTIQTANAVEPSRFLMGASLDAVRQSETLLNGRNDCYIVDRITFDTTQDSGCVRASHQALVVDSVTPSLFGRLGQDGPIPSNKYRASEASTLHFSLLLYVAAWTIVEISLDA